MKVLRSGLISDCRGAVVTASRRHRAPRRQLATFPLAGLAGITFRVSDLDKARRYYQGVLGSAEAFTTSDGCRPRRFGVLQGQRRSVHRGRPWTCSQVASTAKPGSRSRAPISTVCTTCMPRRGLNPTSDQPRPGRQSGVPRHRTRRRDIGLSSSTRQVRSRRSHAASFSIRVASPLICGTSASTRRTASRWCRSTGQTRVRSRPRHAWRHAAITSRRRAPTGILETKFPPLDPNNPGDACAVRTRSDGRGAAHRRSKSSDMRAARDRRRNAAASPISRCARTSATTGTG